MFLPHKAYKFFELLNLKSVKPSPYKKIRIFVGFAESFVNFAVKFKNYISHISFFELLNLKSVESKLT